MAKWAPGGPPPSEARGGWACPPTPTPFPPRNSPFTHSPSLGELGATCWCSDSSCGEGGGKGSPLGTPPPWGSSEDGADTSWAVSPPPAHQDPPLAAVQLVPKHQNPHAGLGHTISWPPWPPFPRPIAVPYVRRLPPPILGTALLLLWNSSARLSIRPSILVPVWPPGTPSWLGAPTIDSVNLSWQPGPSLHPIAHTPTKGPEPLGVKSCTSWGRRNLRPNLGLPPRSTVSPSPPRATVLQSISPPPRPSLCVSL